MEKFDGAIGIDLGTTYSCVAVWPTEANNVEIIPNDQGARTTPSFVAFTDSERLVGDSAKNQAAMNAANTVFDVKRLIGRRYDDSDVQKDIKHFPFKVINDDGQPLIEVEYLGEKKRFTPQELSAAVLSKMRDIAEAKIGKKIEKAVVTVPAYFSDSQRAATKDAGAIAGLNVLRIINEPTAAAIAYGLDSKSNKVKNVLIFDLGGGTFDVSLLKIQGGVFEVLATNGDTHLGGEDFDNALVDYFAEEFKRLNGLDIKDDARALRRLRTAAERAKRSLSSVTTATLEIDSLYQGEDFTSKITRARFEDINSVTFKSTLTPITKVLEDAKLDKSFVDEVVLVGGSTRIPKIQNLVSEFFDGKALNKSINPDEAVAYGAAVQGAVLTNKAGSEKTADLLLLDVVPLSLGVAMEGNIFAPVVPRNTTVPTIKKRTFTTVADNQTTVKFPVYQGERIHCSENESLGEFELTGIPPMPRGQAELEATFEVDANGMLKVTAREKTSGRSAHIQITDSVGHLSSTKIQEMIEGAERFKQADMDFQEKHEARQSLENCINLVEERLSDPLSATKIKNAARMKIEEFLSEGMNLLEIENSDTTKLQRAELELKRSLRSAFGTQR